MWFMQVEKILPKTGFWDILEHYYLYHDKVYPNDKADLLVLLRIFEYLECNIEDICDVIR